MQVVRILRRSQAGDSARTIAQAGLVRNTVYTDLVPTAHREGPYRFFFYSADRNEPPHVHAERDTNRAKFWLDPVRLARSGGFGAAELQHVERLVTAREQLLLRTWNEYFTVAD